MLNHSFGVTSVVRDGQALCFNKELKISYSRSSLDLQIIHTFECPDLYLESSSVDFNESKEELIESIWSAWDRALEPLQLLVRSGGKQQEWLLANAIEIPIELPEEHADRVIAELSEELPNNINEDT